VPPWEKIGGDKSGEYEIAITGKAFQELVLLRDQDKDCTTNAASVLKKVVRNATVFARMAPEDKEKLVIELQTETKEFIAM